MSAKIEKLMKMYPEMVQERDCIAHQLAHFVGLTAEDVIESMYTPRMDGERVQTSNLSDKTAQIALVFRERQGIMNQQWFESLEKRLNILNDEVVFLESALRSLSGRLSEIMWDMVVECEKWAALEKKYNVSHSALYRLRQKAIQELDRLYESHSRTIRDFILR